ncbi:hypothetical protein CLIB1444_01S01596 [[Candida] jaroonii]|uniref:Uncharacterized protein n=1 Tax=[Candida] jaroonii TaxID=467808 RepID=A0ACA9Y1J6_9ASCO|nr:hypothetical protein CLIB1444_01S01596 [[Candida] jaroonii]
MKSLTSLIRKAIVIIFGINIIYLSGCILYYREDFSLDKTVYNKTVDLKYIYIENDNEEPSVNFNSEITKLFEKVESNEDDRFWLKDTELTNTEITINPEHFIIDSENPESWINKNTLFYDIRLTLSLYLNYYHHELTRRDNKNDISIPFHWVDWINLDYLNNDDLLLPLKDRRDCHWMENFIDKHRFKFPELKCINNADITPNMLRDYGFDNHDQLPGYIMHAFTLRRGTIDVRLAQAKSYIMTNLPNPFKLVFLNKNNGTYEVNVDQTSKTRILKSNLLYKYLENNNLIKDGKLPKKLTLDPVKEFQILKQNIEPHYLTKLSDVYGLYETLHNVDVSKTRNLPIPKDAFQYNPDYLDVQLQVFDELSRIQHLDFIQESYVRSLKLSKERNTNTEDVYFRQATLWHDHDEDNIDQDKGYHYDWRFFTGTLTGKRKGWTDKELVLRQEVILDRLSRSWFRFAHEKGLISWIMHGPLLSWYWNGLMFPFDDDLDIQMPARDLARLGELYNQTLVIEDLEEGFGKFLIDVGTFVHNRDISKRENHIDARFIDVDSGLYIDITGLSTSDAKIPSEFENDHEFVDIHEETRNDEIYNDRRKHWYKHEQLSPLKYTSMGGVPMFMPNDISKRLIFEYPGGITKPEFHNWFFIPKINLWVNKESLIEVFDSNDFRKMSQKQKEHGSVDDEKLSQLILDMDESQILKLLSNDDEVLCEYYKTKSITDIHSKEKEYLFEITEKTDGDPNDPSYKKLMVADKQLEGEEFDKYNRFIHANMKMTKPLRKSLFQFEVVDQPLHHKET